MESRIKRIIFCLLINYPLLHASDGEYHQGVKEGHIEGRKQAYLVGLEEGQKRIAPYERNSKASYIIWPKDMLTKPGRREQFLRGWLEGYKKGWIDNYHEGYRAGLDLPAIHEEENEDTAQGFDSVQQSK